MSILGKTVPVAACAVLMTLGFGSAAYASASATEVDLAGQGAAASVAAGARLAPDAARSTVVSFVNYTNAKLVRKTWTMNHGEWTANRLPPEAIPGQTRKEWGSESDGFATGTEASVVYSSPSGDITVYWDNPYVGSNSYNCNAPSSYICRRTDGTGGGDNAWVEFTLNMRL